MPGVYDQLTNSLQAAPELSSAPGLVVPNATLSQDPSGTAQGMAHVANVQQLGDLYQEQANKVGGHSFLSKTLGWVGKEAGSVVKPIGGALNYLGAPLREVQRQYRYFHDVWQQHGALDAIMEGLPVAAGAIGGGFLAGPEGAALGAELVGGIEARVVHKDSWDRVADGEAYLDKSGRKVSLGRDIASMLHLPGTNKGGEGFLSGVIDAIGDLTADPLALGGKIRGAAMSAEGAEGQLAHFFGGLNVSRVEAAYDQYGSFRRAAQDIAGMDAGQVAARYKGLAPIAKDLGDADTPEKVVDVFRQNAKKVELTSSRLPTKTMTRVPFAAMRDALGNVGAGTEDRGIIERTISRFTRQPEVFDPETMKFNAKSFNLGDDFGAEGLFRSLRMGQTRDVAESVTNDYLNATSTADRMKIVRNAYNDMFDRMGIAPDEETRQGLFHRIEDVTGGEQMGKGSGPAWARGTDGRRIDTMPVFDDAGNKIGTKTEAILPSDAPRMAFPDFNEVRQVMEQADGGPLAKAKELYGKADAWVLDHYTTKVFKKLVLLSGGFASRVAAGEIIPIGFRDGFNNLMESRLASSYAKYGIDTLKEAAGDESHFSSLRAATWKVLRPVAERMAMNSPEFAERTDLAMASIMLHDGEIVNPTLSAGHHYSNMVDGGWIEQRRNALHQLIQEVPEGQRFGDQVASFIGSDTANASYAWQAQLNKLANDPAAQAAARAWVEGGTGTLPGIAGGEEAAVRAATGWLDEQPAEALSHNPRHFESIHDGMSPHESWGRSIFDTVKGSAYSPDGKPIPELMDAIARGETPTVEQLQGLSARQPRNLVGEVKTPPTDESTMSRIANFGHRKALSPMINWMTREPIFQDHLYQEYKLLTDAGLSTSDALHLGEVRASNRMVSMVHNLNERSYLSQSMSNYAPFFFAQEQAWKRAGRLFAEDPGAFRQVQLMSSAMMNIGHVKKDGSGQDHLIYPGLGFLGKGMTGLLGKIGVPIVGAVPMSFGANLQSMSPALPLTEREVSISPLVAVGAQGLRGMFPELSPALSKVVGDYALHEGMMDTLIPNTTLRRLHTAISAPDRDRSFLNSQMQVLQTLAHQQEQHPDQKIIPSENDSPIEWQQFLDRVRNQTRIAYGIKAIFGAVTPTSPVMNLGDSTLSDDLQALIQTKGVSQGTDEFLKTHPDATMFTVSKTHTSTSAPMVPTSPAGQFLNAHLDTIKNYAHGGAWLIPQTADAFDGGVYNEQLALHLREQKSPDQFFKDMYIASANKEFYDDLIPQHQALQKQYQSNPAMLKVVDQVWTKTLEQFGAQHPVWYEDYRSPNRAIERQRTIADFRRMADDPNLPASPQWGGIKQLTAAYDAFTTAYEPGRSDQFIADKRKRLQASWDTLMDTWKKQDPTMEAVINKVFKQVNFGQDQQIQYYEAAAAQAGGA